MAWSCPLSRAWTWCYRSSQKIKCPCCPPGSRRWPDKGGSCSGSNLSRTPCSCKLKPSGFSQFENVWWIGVINDGYRIELGRGQERNPKARCLEFSSCRFAMSWRFPRLRRFLVEKAVILQVTSGWSRRQFCANWPNYQLRCATWPNKVPVGVGPNVRFQQKGLVLSFSWQSRNTTKCKGGYLHPCRIWYCYAILHCK